MDPNRLHFGPFALDLESGELRQGGDGVPIAALPARLLRYLALNRHRTVSHDELVGAIWGGVAVEEATLHQAVRHARRAVQDDGRSQRVIRTASGLGYRFVADVADAPAAGLPAGKVSYVGRSGLLAGLDERIAAAAAGHGGGVLLRGDPGIGKSRTVEEIAHRAAHAGMLVVRGGGLRSGAPPWWPWIEAFRSLATARPVDELRHASPHLLDPAAASLVQGGESTRFRHYEVAARCLREASALGPIALVLEDLHEASAATLELFEHVVPMASRSPLLLLGTYRRAELVADPARARVLSRIAAYPWVETVEIEPLSAIEVAYLLEQSARRRLPAALVGSLARHTGGSPFFAVELARILPEDEQLRTEEAWNAWVPRGAVRLLGDRLAPLAYPSRRVLVSAAAIGGGFDAGLLGRVEPNLDVRAALAEASALGFVSELEEGSGLYRFAHALIRDALQAELARDDAGRRATHLRIADALAGDANASDAEFAHHLCEAGPAAGADRIAVAVQRAADAAARVGDLDSAWQLYRRALSALSEAGERFAALRCEMLVSAGEIAVHDVAREEGRKLLEDALELARRYQLPELFGRAVLALAYRNQIVGVADRRLVGLLEEAVERVGDRSDSLAARLRSRAAIEIRYEAGGLPRASRIIEAAIAQARASDDALAIAQVCEDATLVRWSVTDPEAWLALNREIVDAAALTDHTELRFQGMKGLATAHLERGDRVAYDHALDDCANTAELYPSPFLRAVVAGLRAGCAFMEGDLERGEQGALEAAASGLAAVAPLAAGQIFYHRLETGRLAELEGATRGFVEESPGIATWQAALARLLADAGRADEARRELSGLEKLDALPRDRNWFPALAILAECCVLLGDRERAPEVLEQIRPHARVNVVLGNGSIFYGNGAHFLGMLCALLERSDEAEEHFERALAMHERMRAEAWVLRTRAEQALLYAGRGDSKRAAALAEEVAKRCRELGLLRCAERAESARRPDGGER